MMKPRVIVVGNGMVGHRFIEHMIKQGGNHHYEIVTFCEEPYLAYDRVNLSRYFVDRDLVGLALSSPEYYRDNNITVHLNSQVVTLNRTDKTVSTSADLTLSYDILVLATGSSPFVPPVQGRDVEGVFVYRTIEDLKAIEAYTAESRAGAVIGGGLLGLECANALKSLGLTTHIVEVSPHLMPRQLDSVGGLLLKRQIETLGVQVHTSAGLSGIVSDEKGHVSGLSFADETSLELDIVVFSAGIRPRDELARASGLEVGPRGGIVIDGHCRTSDPNIYAIGECALYAGQIFGLVAPGYDMAEVVADELVVSPEPKRFSGADMSTRLKLMGVDVASFGDALAATPEARELTFFDARAGIYKKLVIDADGKQLLGGILIGDIETYGTLLQIMRNGIALPPHPEDLILPARDGSYNTLGAMVLPDTAKICSCENVSKGSICLAISNHGLSTIGEIAAMTGAGAGCKGCVPSLKTILKEELEKRGISVRNDVCEHFPYTRQELYHIIRVNRIKSFDTLLERYGTGLGCEVCKPVAASIFASTWNEYILDNDLATLQDTNDTFLANIQRDGTYSVVPRVPGGEVTPEKLIAIGQVAKEFDLYVKITGAQRIDLFGAQVNQLPAIWERLIEAGFESGHAYGKALRTVKSCVGSTWCRYGQQDSVTMAIDLENRYKGIRAPHKIKSAVSGCSRECAEAQGKDFGLIATEKGYNLYVGGNGGRNPRHGTLLAEDLSEEEVIKLVDRFLMFYIRTADRLQRTATWLDSLEGGIDYLREVIIDDSLGICEELEKDMQHLIATYQCEWKTTLENPEKLKRFRHFVDSEQTDPHVLFVRQRGQKRPAYVHEREQYTASPV